MIIMIMDQSENLTIESIGLLSYHRIGQRVNGDDPIADMDFIRHQGDAPKGLSPATICLENKCDKALIKFSYFICLVCPIPVEPVNSYLKIIQDIITPIQDILNKTLI